MANGFKIYAGHYISLNVILNAEMCSKRHAKISCKYIT